MASDRLVSIVSYTGCLLDTKPLAEPLLTSFQLYHKQKLECNFHLNLSLRMRAQMSSEKRWFCGDLNVLNAVNINDIND